jgi:hypothetical protein
MVGGASVPESRSPRMLDFMRRYVERFGTWNDEAGTKPMRSNSCSAL